MTHKSDIDSQERVVTTCCSYDCGARCLLRVHVSGTTINRIGTDNRPGPGLKACPRGLSQKEIVYAPDRLTHPMKRVGDRGSGKFDPIPWEDALEIVSRELRRVKEQYGTHSIFLMNHYGSLSPLHGTLNSPRRFFSLLGGMYHLLGDHLLGSCPLCVSGDLWNDLFRKQPRQPAPFPIDHNVGLEPHGYPIRP